MKSEKTCVKPTTSNTTGVDAMKESHMGDLNSFRVLLTDEEVEDAIFDIDDPDWVRKRSYLGGILRAAIAAELEVWAKAVKEQKSED